MRPSVVVTFLAALAAAGPAAAQAPEKLPLTLPQGWRAVPTSQGMTLAQSPTGKVHLTITTLPDRWDSGMDAATVAREVGLTMPGTTRLDVVDLGGTPGVSFATSQGPLAQEAMIVPDGDTLLFALCASQTAESRRGASPEAERVACATSLKTLRGRGLAAPPEIPFVPPERFRRGLGRRSGVHLERERQVGYWGLDAEGAILAADSWTRPLVEKPDEDALSKLTDTLASDGLRVRDLSIVKLGDVSAVRFRGELPLPTGQATMVGYMIPRGDGPLLFLQGLVPTSSLPVYEPIFEAAARSAKGLAAPSAGSVHDKFFAAVAAKPADPKVAEKKKPPAVVTNVTPQVPLFIYIAIAAVVVIPLGLTAWWVTIGAKVARKRRREQAVARARGPDA
jgi:hypothetical protein